MSDPLALTAGDLVVHDQHGIGKFVEMTERVVGGARREYLVLEYASAKRGGGSDRLYVPMDSLDQPVRADHDVDRAVLHAREHCF